MKEREHELETLKPILARARDNEMRMIMMMIEVDRLHAIITDQKALLDELNTAFIAKLHHDLTQAQKDCQLQQEIIDNLNKELEALRNELEEAKIAQSVVVVEDQQLEENEVIVTQPEEKVVRAVIDLKIVKNLGKT